MAPPPPPRRKLSIDFDQLIDELHGQPADSADDRSRARAARELVEAVLHHAPELHRPEHLMALTDEQLDDAHALIRGGAGEERHTGQAVHDPGGALQAAEEIDPEGWEQTLAKLRRLPPGPDPGIAAEFI